MASHRPHLVLFAAAEARQREKDEAHEELEELHDGEHRAAEPEAEQAAQIREVLVQLQTQIIPRNGGRAARPNRTSICPTASTHYNIIEAEQSFLVGHVGICAMYNCRRIQNNINNNTIILCQMN